MIPISKPYIGEAEKQAVMEVLESGMLVQGPRTAKLEERFAQLCGVKHAIATSSGTTALHVALLAHGVGPGDEVITSPFTFIASANSIVYVGAKPVFVDIDPETFNINPALIEAAITPRTKAIMPVHIYGYPCDMDAIQAIANKHGLAIIEDSAQAVGADIRGRMTGSFGTGCFSLYATKNIHSGEGGIITTDDDTIADACRLIRAHGSRRRYYHDILGYNFRLSDLHAAIGLAQMDRVEEFTTIRRANAEYLSAHITNARTPQVRPGYGHVWHQYVIRVGNGHQDEGATRDAAVQHLTAAGVGTGIFYPIPANRQQHLLDLGLGGEAMPVAEQLSKEVIALPIHPALSQHDLATIVAAVNSLPR
ncbi:MAG: DegT/DnrJ/EryC1/StrS family aminotransferase [Roseiflexaceae bacterium]